MIAVFCSVTSFFYIRNDISLCLRHGYFVDILLLHNTEKVQLHSISVGTFGYQIQLKHALPSCPNSRKAILVVLVFSKVMSPYAVANTTFSTHSPSGNAHKYSIPVLDS